MPTSSRHEKRWRAFALCGAVIATLPFLTFALQQPEAAWPLFTRSRSGPTHCVGAPSLAAKHLLTAADARSDQGVSRLRRQAGSAPVTQQSRSQPATSAGSEPATAPLPRFAARSELVLVPVTVLDRHGAPIEGLAAKDFAVLVDKRPQPLVTVDIVSGSNRARQPVLQLPAGTYSNALPVSPDDTHLVVLLVDFVNTNIQQRSYLRGALLRFLARGLQPAQQIALYGMTSSLLMLHPFTASTRELIESARRLSKTSSIPADLGFLPRVPAQTAGMPISPDATDSLESRRQGMGRGTDTAMEFFFFRSVQAEANVLQHTRAELTLAEFRQLARSLAGVPGKKTVIWLTGDASPLDPSLMYTVVLNNEPLATIATPWAEIATTYERLNSAGISLFPVDVRGQTNAGLIAADEKVSRETFTEMLGQTAGGGTPYFTPTDMRQGEAARAALAMQAVAAETGGTVFQGSNDIAGQLERAEKLWSDYYVLSFRPELKDTQPAYHRISVRVNVPGARVLARRGFTHQPAEMHAAEPALRVDLIDASQSPVDLTEIPLTLRTGATEYHGELNILPVTLNVSGEALHSEHQPSGEQYDLTFMTIVRDHTGKLVHSASDRFNRVIPSAEAEQFRRAGFTYATRIRAKGKDVYFGRVIVRDNLAGHIGTITLRLPWE